MNRYFVWAGLFLWLFTACNQEKKISRNRVQVLNKRIDEISAKVDSLENVIAETERKSLAERHDTLFFAIRRTPCLGTCPVFTMQVFSDGFVKYHGRNYVDLVGIYTGRLKPAQVAQVKQWFTEAGFYDLKDSYSDARLDIPATIIEYNGPGGYKSVEASTAIPKPFRLLAGKLEGLIKEIDWDIE